MKYYLLDENKNLVEGFDKEGFLGLLEQAIELGTLENIDEDSAVASKLRSALNGSTHHIEFLTEAEYNQLVEDEELVANTYYFITDDTTAEDLEEAITKILNGTTPVAEATHAQNATHATSADSATTATNAGHATSADSALSANSANSANYATNAGSAGSAGSATNADNLTKFNNNFTELNISSLGVVSSLVSGKTYQIFFVPTDNTAVNFGLVHYTNLSSSTNAVGVDGSDRIYYLTIDKDVSPANQVSITRKTTNSGSSTLATGKLYYREIG